MIHFNRLETDHQSYPILGTGLGKEAYKSIDLSISNPKLQQKVSPRTLENHIKELHAANPNHILFGGYLEHRAIYVSPLFDPNQDSRCIHLGVDLWTSSDTMVHAPLDGIIHSLQYNADLLDYGYTIILQHTLANESFYTLYGHLSDYKFDDLSKGQPIRKGEHFCNIGPYAQNGGWPPHLHFQLIRDIQDYRGDYPGVVTPSEKEKYSHLCPDPTALALGFKKYNNHESI